MGAQEVLTYHNDNARTGQNLNETTLTLAKVNSATFGKLFVLAVDGKVDAQPLCVSAVSIPGKGTHNVLVVASEHDSVYGFDADTGSALWQVTLLKTGETTSDDRGCGQVSPEIGVTATPVIDPTHGIFYLVAMSKDTSGKYFQRLHALSLANGTEMLGGPMDVQATFPGTGDNSVSSNVVFDPKQYKERPGLLLLNHVVYTSWSSHCDIRPYTGWVIGYDASSLKQVSVLNLAPNGSAASVWASGAGPAADGQGNIYLLAANGTFDTTLDSKGFPSQGDFGNAFLKLSTGNHTLAVADYFNMFNTVAESSADGDLGSGGALVLPDLADAQGLTRQLAVGAGKDQNIYLVDRNNMGKFNHSNNDAIYQELPSALHGPEFGMPAYFDNKVYFGAAGDSMLAFDFSSARLLSSPSSQTSQSFGYPGTTPSVSANGTSNGIVWAVENSDPAVLHAYDANDLTDELYNSSQAGSRDLFGSGNKFITPTIAHGRVYVGTTNGVATFGLLQSGGPAVSLSGDSLSFGSQIVFASGVAQTVTLSNTGQTTLDISAFNASGDFSQTTSCASSVAPEASCQINVTFKPTAAGARTGTLTIVDNAPGSPQTISLTGTGVDFSLSASPPSASVTRPQSATYTLNLAPAGGFNQVVMLTCTGQPSESTCTITPASLTSNGSTGSTATVVVTTTAPAAPSLLARRTGRWRSLHSGPALLHWLFILAIPVSLMMKSRRRAWLSLGVITLFVLLWASCGGRGGGTGSTGNPGTTPGTYTLTVTGTFTSGSTTLSHHVTLTLTVN
jgi:hypothetical protein